MLIVPSLHCIRATLIRAHKPHVIGREIWVGVVDLVEPGRLGSILIVNHAAPGGAFVSHSCLDNCSARRDCDEKRTWAAIFHLGHPAVLSPTPLKACECTLSLPDHK